MIISYKKLRLLYHPPSTDVVPHLGVEDLVLNLHAVLTVGRGRTM